jgi:DNA replication and repair protein RecF
MILYSLDLTSFRCYDTLTLELNPNVNIIVGDNAQGKTSILEAIHMLCLTKSHKLTKDMDLIQKDKEFAKINGEFHLNTTKVELNMILSKNGKKAKYNKIEVSKLSDYIGRVNVVMFAPEDLDLVKGSPQGRRRFLDIEIGQLSNTYVKNLNHYKRLLRERNEVLKGLSKKQKYDKTMLDVITDQLIHYAEKIIKARSTFITELNETLHDVFPLFGSDPTLNIVYKPSIKDNLKKVFKQKETIDILAKATQIGPHRDDFEFMFDQEPIKHYASQGQIRSVVLALKFAIADMIYIQKKQYPIILLDDVFSELDQSRQHNVLSYLDKRAQVFITTTHIDHIDFNIIDNYRIYHIESGRLKGAG